MGAVEIEVEQRQRKQLLWLTPCGPELAGAQSENNNINK